MHGAQQAPSNERTCDAIFSSGALSQEIALELQNRDECDRQPGMRFRGGCINFPWLGMMKHVWSDVAQSGSGKYEWYEQLQVVGDFAWGSEGAS